MYETDPRIVLALDAGGTNLIFSAIAGNREIVEPVHFHSVPDDLDRMLSTLVEGFEAVRRQLDAAPVAISFAFPGPADYAHGIIGDLPNFPSFRGGVALGPFLERKFGIPVFINNDGNLFAYGEAISGALPDWKISFPQRLVLGTRKFRLQRKNFLRLHKACVQR